MPAALVIRSNGTLERYWIQNPVLRVGSAAACDVRLRDAKIAPHVLTVEFRNGRYFVHNRSKGVVHLDGAALTPNSSTSLKAGQLLQLDGEVTIALECTGDPSPAPPPVQSTRPAVKAESDVEEDWVVHDNPTDETAEAAEVAIDLKPILQLCVIGLCFLGIAGMLILKMRPSTAPVATDAFADIKQVVDAASVSGSQWSLHISQALQRAERARLRQDYETSLDEFYRARDALSSAPKNIDGEFVNKSSGFVRNRIAEIR